METNLPQEATGTENVVETTGIEDAIEAAKTQDLLAEALGVTQQAVSGWLKQGWTPLDRAIEIEAQFGIPRARLVSPRIRSAFANVEL
jgi:predicted transcriptional regulator